MTKTTIKERQFEILCSVEDICKAEGIKTYLIGESALSAVRDADTCDYPEMAIDIKDADRLIKAVSENGGGLRTYGVFNDPSRPVFSMEIYDPDTIDFSVFDFYKRKVNCMKVTVRFIRKAVPDKAGRVLTSSMIRLLRKPCPPAIRKSINASLMKRLGAVYAANKGRLMLGDDEISRRFIDEAREVTIHGHAFRIPGRAEDYLGSLYGDAWDEHPVREFVESKDRFRDTDHSWEEYRRRLRAVDTKEYARLWKEYKPMHETFMKARNAVEANYVILERTHARIRLWKKYKDRKEEILGLVAEGRLPEAGEILGDYMKEMVRFHDLGLGLCFDPDLLDAACAVFAAEGKGGLEEEMKRMVPPQHMKEFVLLDYKGNEI